jgi:hypothetical protein
MKHGTLLVVAIAAAMACSAHADDMAGAVPAIIVLQSETADVASGPQGQTLTLAGIHPLVAVAGGLEAGRQFHSFRIEDFSEGWNTCNDLKDQQGMWHDNGLNTLVEFTAGPDSGEGYRLHSPLYTAANRDDASRDTGGAAGSARLMLDDAMFDEAAETQSFAIRGGTMTDGSYENVVVLVECVIEG